MYKSTKTIRKYFFLFLSLSTFAVGLGCAHQKQTLKSNDKLIKTPFIAKSDSSVSGWISFEPENDRLLVKGLVSGLKPNSTHGFHIHKKGDCSSSDAKSAGGHFAPDSQRHGGPYQENHHFGDLGNITADKDGTIIIQKTIENANLSKQGKYSLLNRAIIIHEKKDNFSSQPAGDSGARIACAKIAYND